jgi:probable rRNA maturation factor
LIISRRKWARVDAHALQRFADHVQRTAPLDRKLKGEVNILLTGDAEMQELNQQFRRKDKPTDVLSFPATMEGLAGELAISVPIAVANGRAFGHEPMDELKILVLHGMLHLAGYDHEVDTGQMERLEKKLRTQLGLTDSLIQRTMAGTTKGKSPRPKAGNTAARGKRTTKTA